MKLRHQLVRAYFSPENVYGDENLALSSIHGIDYLYLGSKTKREHKIPTVIMQMWG